MSQIDTELLKLEDIDKENKEEDMKILNEYNQYLTFLEKYFSDKNAQPLKLGPNLIKQIFNT